MEVPEGMFFCWEGLHGGRSGVWGFWLSTEEFVPCSEGRRMRMGPNKLVLLGQKQNWAEPPESVAFSPEGCGFLMGSLVCHTGSWGLRRPSLFPPLLQDNHRKDIKTLANNHKQEMLSPSLLLLDNFVSYLLRPTFLLTPVSLPLPPDTLQITLPETPLPAGHSPSRGH